MCTKVDKAPPKKDGSEEKNLVEPHPLVRKKNDNGEPGHQSVYMSNGQEHMGYSGHVYYFRCIFRVMTLSGRLRHAHKSRYKALAAYLDLGHFCLSTC